MKHCTIFDANFCLREVTVPPRLMRKEKGREVTVPPRLMMKGREDRGILMRSEMQFLLNSANG